MSPEFDINQLKITATDYGVAGQQEVWFEYKGQEYFCEFSWNNYDGYTFFFYDNSENKNQIDNPDWFDSEDFDPIEFESELDLFTEGV